MSIEYSQHKRIFVAEETTFATVLGEWASGSYTTARLLPIIEGSWKFTPVQDQLDPKNIQLTKFNKTLNVLGKKSATFSFSIPLYSSGTAAADGVTALGAATSYALGKLLKQYFGGEVLPTGALITGGSTSSAIVDDAAASTNFPANNIIGVTTGSGAANEWRVVDSTSSQTVTPKLNFTATPDSSNAYAGARYYFTDDSNPNDSDSLQFFIQGPEAQDNWAIMGCAPTSMTLGITSGEIPTLTFEYTAAQWTNNTSGVYGYSTTGATVANFSPVPNVAGHFYRWTNGTVTYTASTGSTEGSQVHISQETFNFNCRFIPVTSPSGTNTIFRYVRGKGDGPVVSGTFNVPFQSTTWTDLRDNRTNVGLQRVFGGTPGSTFIIHIPTVQIVQVDYLDDNGLQYQQVSWEGRNDLDSAGGTELLDSPVNFYAC